jgi:hypothetical protein
MISVPFALGTNDTSDLPLSDEERGMRLTHEDGSVVTLTLRWPDHPAVAPARLRMFAAQTVLERDAMQPDGSQREDVEPERLVELALPRDAALREYAAALVVGWSVADPCTPDAVLALFTRAPFVLTLVLKAANEGDRFLAPSLRLSAPESQPVSEPASA